MNTRVNNSRHRIPAKSLSNIPGLFTEEMIRDGMDSAQRDHMAQTVFVFPHRSKTGSR